ncbi:MAG: hypothetical protein ACK4Y4_11705 [Brevundimonas sp.]
MHADIRRWRPKGVIHFWFEADKRQGDGWHLAADAQACHDLDELVELGKASPYPARFSIPLGNVTGAVGKAPSKLLIAYNASWSPDHWIIKQNGDEVLWELGATSFECLRGVAADLRRGKLDYALGGNEADQRVWLWWPPAS